MPFGRSKEEKIAEKVKKSISEAKKKQAKGVKTSAKMKYRSALRVLSENEKTLMNDRQRFSELYREIGRGLYEIGRYDISIESFERALDLNEDNFKAWLEKGETYVSMTDMEEYALHCFE